MGRRRQKEQTRANQATLRGAAVAVFCAVFIYILTDTALYLRTRDLFPDSSGCVRARPCVPRFVQASLPRRT